MGDRAQASASLSFSPLFAPSSILEALFISTLYLCFLYLVGNTLYHPRSTYRFS